MMISGLELSSKKVAYLKYIYEKGSTVSTSEIALHFDVSAATVSRAISEMAQDGYIVHVPYRGVIPSETGASYARFLFKRHRILSLMLVQHGVADNRACREVERFESHVSREVVDSLCRGMGHPTHGICGIITHDEGCMNAKFPPRTPTGQSQEQNL